MTIRIDIHSQAPALLGESPLWDAARGWLWWVDARAQRIFASDINGAPMREFELDLPIGSIALASEGLVAALSDGFYAVDAETGAARMIAPVAPPSEGLRLNDGKTDRQGRFLAGHMFPKGGTAGELWQLGLDGVARKLDSGIGISNGLCVSPDGRALYHTDSATGMLRRYDYDTATGAVSNRIDLIDSRPQGSGIDGATVDSQGRIWAALVLAHKIACYSPEGALLQLIDSPVQFPSCPAFGGADLDTLFVTSIAHSGHALISTSENAGHVIAIRGLEARGLPETPWAPLSQQDPA